MPNMKHAEILWQGVDAWDAWCHKNFGYRDLHRVDLRNIGLDGGELRMVFLREANLGGAKLYETIFVDVGLAGDRCPWPAATRRRASGRGDHGMRAGSHALRT
jgi:uncharacterized protein YjbI with pentapeptide repeats